VAVWPPGRQRTGFIRPGRMRAPTPSNHEGISWPQLRAPTPAIPEWDQYAAAAGASASKKLIELLNRFCYSGFAVAARGECETIAGPGI